MNRLAAWLRRPGFYRLFTFVLGRLPFLLPAKRLHTTANLLAIRHPKPAARFHVVLMPRRPIRSFAELAPDDPFLPELTAVVQNLVTEHALGAYRLIVNGGAYQEFPHLHFHLISEEPGG